MARGSRISILGLYTWDDTLFEKFVIPSSIDKNVLVQNLLMECAEFEILYPNPKFMKDAIEQWSMKELDKWNKMNEILSSSNPLNDVNLTEITTHDFEKHETGTDTKKETGTDTNVFHSESESTNQVNGWNDGLSDRNKVSDEEDSTNTRTPNLTNTRTPNLTNTDSGEKIKKISGLSGKYLKQDVILKEMKIRNLFNIDDIIIDDFKNRFCLLIY